MNYGRSTAANQQILSHSIAQRVWRSFLNPNALCPKCKRPVFYYQSWNGGRVFFDDLGPPWPKHPCTTQPAWRWSVDADFKLKEGLNLEPSNSSSWQRDGWIPVADVLTNPGRPTLKSKDGLAGATVWSAKDASELKVLWPSRVRFDWHCLVMMRQDPKSPYRVEFQTIQLKGDAVRIQRLMAVKDDFRTTGPTLLFRLRDKR